MKQEGQRTKTLEMNAYSYISFNSMEQLHDIRSYYLLLRSIIFRAINDYFGLFVNAFVLKSALGADVEQLIADARCDAATLPNFFDGAPAAPLPASTGKAHPAVAALLKTADEAASLALDYLRNAGRA